MKINLNYFCIALLTALLSQTAFAYHHAGHKHSGRMQQFSEKLNMTPEQKAKFDVLEQTMHKKMNEIRKRSMRLDASLHALSKDAKLDESKLNMLIKQKADLMAVMLKDKVTFKHKLYNLLTPEQKQSLEKMMQTRMHKHNSTSANKNTSQTTP